MKNLKVLTAITALILLGQTVSCAIQSGNISQQKEINKNTLTTIERGKNDSIEKMNKLTERYYNNLRTCEPLHVKYFMDIFGLKFGFNIDINGWQNNKCAYRMSANLDGIGKDIREVYNVKVTDEQLEKIKPVVECNFTKEQLNLTVDAIIARNQRSSEQLRQMLKNPDQKYTKSAKSTTNLTKEEEQLIMLLMTSNVCTVPNKEELTNQITEIMHQQ